MRPGRRGPEPQPRRQSTARSDAEGRAQAAHLDADLELWSVYWSLGKRQFYAFYLGPSVVDPVKAEDPAELRREAARAHQDAVWRAHQDHFTSLPSSAPSRPVLPRHRRST